MTPPVTFVRARTTGPELLAALEQRADELGLPFNDFVRPLNTNPREFIVGIRRAQRPTALTFDRVEALLNGRPIPPPQRKSRRLCDPVDGEPGGPPPDPVDRDPCFLCGTRADIGCQHQAVGR